MSQASYSLPRRSLIAAVAASAGLAALPGPSRAASSGVLRIGNQKGGLRSLFEASGIEKDLPYKIEWSEFGAAAPLLEAMNAGALDLGHQGDFAFVTVFAAGAPLKAIGASRALPAGQAILVHDPAIKTVADLRGRKVAGNRAGWGQYLIDAALQKAGVPASEVGITLLTPADAALAFRSGTVDAWAVWDPYVAFEVEQFGARVLVDAAGLSPSITFVAATDDAIKTKRPLLVDFLKRFDAGWQWSQTHIPDYAKYNSVLTHFPQSVLERAYTEQQTKAVPLDAALLAEYQQVADQSVAFGLLPNKLDVRTSVDLSFSAIG
jgi:sulfonate transport system substrate-binding protein